jgi:predicted ArsR family transcriptional regulator
MDGLIVQAERYIADSEVEAIKKRVLEIVRQHGEISQRDLARKTQFLKQRDRSEVLNDLAEAGRIVIEKRQSGMGRPTFVISLAAEK